MHDLIESLMASVTIVDFIDVVIISFIIYKVLQLIRGSRASYIIFISVGLVILLSLSKIMGLRATNWLISNFTGYFFIIIVILFQQEIRRALASMVEGRLIHNTREIKSKIIDEVVKTAALLANRQIGALIVFERKNNLDPIITIGQRIDAEVSRDLLRSIFIPYSPLHDGAVVVKGSRLSYAGCILPLTRREDIPSNFGTRHRAAMGIAEETDAVVVVVSEESGNIRVCVGGVMTTELGANELHDTLENLFKMSNAE